MDGRMLGVLCLLIILVYTPYKTKATGTKITRGLTAGKNLAQALKDGNFPKSLTNIGSNVAPFLAVLGPLASLALQFIPTKDSPELAYMKTQFQAVSYNTRSCYNKAEFNVYSYLFIYLTLPQGQGHHDSICQLLWARITFHVGGNRSTQRKPMTFGRALTDSFHIRTAFESHCGMHY